MPACARAEIVREGEVAAYHVYTRCVRRAFLCGDDPLTGRNYDYRRDWIRAVEERLAVSGIPKVQRLAGSFGA